MTRATRAIALVIALCVVAGCQTVTGRRAGQWVDDKTTTAKVKTAIAAARVGTLTRVDVDTYDGTVYLTGYVESEAMKQQLVDAARGAADRKPVVSNLAVLGHPSARAEASDSAAASLRTDRRAEARQLHGTMVGQPSAPARTPSSLGRLKFSRLDAEPGARGRFAAYDQGGRRVATVYTLPASEPRGESIADFDAGERRIHHVSLYSHGGPDGIQYHLVLWHVPREEAALLQ